MTDKQAQYRPKFSRLWERYDEAAKDNAVHMREILEQALDALEAAERYIAITERVAGEKLESAEKRITELEARQGVMRSLCNHQLYWDVSNVQRCAICGVSISSADGKGAAQ